MTSSKNAMIPGSASLPQESKSLTGLESAYDALKQQYKAVNVALRDTSIQLNSKVGELDVLTYYLDSILSHISQGLMFINLDGNITSCNAAAETLLGVDSHQILFQKFSEHFRDDLFGFSMADALEKRQTPNKTVVLIDAVRGVQHELEIEPTWMLKGVVGRNVDSLQGLIVLMRDVTDIHQLQIQAQRNDRLKGLGEMAAMVAHEIRNPLGGIKGFASLLQRDLKEQPELQQLAAYIVEGADNLNRLVTNVLNYARPLQVCIEETDLIALTHELCQHVDADESRDPRIRITQKSTQDTLIVPADAHLLKSALLNLVVNAIQALPEGGDITIALSQKQRNAYIEVSDTGIGIPRENLQKIFSPFFTTKTTGNGFGLAEVHQVIQAHGGTLEATSVEGKGSTFTIKLPLGNVKK